MPYKTIALRKETKARFDSIKIYERETSDDILNRLIDFFERNKK